MTRRGTGIAISGVAAALAVALAASAGAETADSTGARPRGVVEDCSSISGFGASPRDLSGGGNLVVGPLALLHAGVKFSYSHAVGGNKLFVVVRGGHRVTLELSRRTRRGAGLVFGRYPDGEVRLRDARRVVTFIACRRGEDFDKQLDGWPVSSWVGGLLASSPRCVPLLVWVDDEPTPRRVVILFGVRSCS